MTHIEVTGVDYADTKLALKLATLAADWIDAKPSTKAAAVSKARLVGAAETANILGYGNTPAHVEIEAISWAREVKRPNDLSAYQRDRKEWSTRAAVQLGRILHEMKH